MSNPTDPRIFKSMTQKKPLYRANSIDVAMPDQTLAPLVQAVDTVTNPDTNPEYVKWAIFLNNGFVRDRYFETEIFGGGGKDTKTLQVQIFVKVDATDVNYRAAFAWPLKRPTSYAESHTLDQALRTGYNKFLHNWFDGIIKQQIDKDLPMLIEKSGGEGVYQKFISKLSISDLRSLQTSIKRKLETVEKNPGPRQVFYDPTIMEITDGVLTIVDTLNDCVDSDSTIAVPKLFLAMIRLTVGKMSTHEFNKLVEICHIDDESKDDWFNDRSLEINDFMFYIDDIITDSDNNFSPVLTYSDYKFLLAFINYQMQYIEKNPGPNDKKVPFKKVEKAVKKALEPSKKKQHTRHDPKEVPVRGNGANYRTDLTAAVHSSAIKTRRSAVAVKIAKAVCLPGESPLIRWGSEFASDATALASPFRRTDALFGPVASSNGLVPPSETFAMSFKDMQRSFIYQDPNTANRRYTYSVCGVSNLMNQNNTTTRTPPTTSWTARLVGVEECELFTPYANCVSSYAPHGSVLYAGSDGMTDKRYLWIDSGFVNASFSSMGNGALDGQQIVLTASFWTPDGISQIATPITFSSGTANTTFSVTPGYISFSIAIVASSTFPANTGVSIGVTGITLNNAPAVPTLCHLPSQGFNNKVGSIDAVRVYGNSLMYTNDASFNGRQGKITAYQMSAGEYWYGLIQDSGTSLFNKVSSYLEGSDENVNRSDNGFRVWQKLTSPKDWELINTFTCIDGVLYDSFYPINPSNDYLIMVASVTNAAGQDGYWTQRQSVEFKTRDSWFDKELTPYNRFEMDDAIAILLHVPQYTTNEFHLKDIWNSIKNVGTTVAKGVVDYGPNVMRVAKLLLSFA